MTGAYRFFFLLGLLHLAFLGGGQKAEAHISRSTVVFLELRPEAIEAEIEIPIEALDPMFTHPLYDGPSAVAQFGPELKTLIAKDFAILTPAGESWPFEIGALEGSTSGEDQLAKISLAIIYRPPHSQEARSFMVRDELFPPNQFSPAALIFVRGDWQSGVFRDHPELIGTIASQTKTLAVDRRNGSTWRGFRGVFVLGLRHILEGVDHLMFLFMLLLPAPLLCAQGRWQGVSSAKRAWLQIAAIVSSFTFGHSITLLLGSLSRVHPPTRWVEVLIAVSVLISAVNALKPLFARREWIIAAFFGLIHGLSFSSALADLGLSGGNLVLAVFGFNLGIEAMQIFLVLLIMPLLVWLAQRRRYTYLRYAGALFGIFASVVWILQRAFDIKLPFNIGS